MTPDQVQLLTGAVVALLTVLTTYIGLQVKLNQQVLKQHDVALNGPTAARDARITALEVAGGGRLGVSSVPPAWDQLQDPLPTGALPAQRTQECGEEVAAMIIMWRHGVPVSADALRAMLRGPDGYALTTAADVAALLSLCNVDASAHALSVDDAKKAARAETGAGRPVALLVRVPTGGFHWLCCYSSDDRECHFVDPWGGFRIAQSWDQLLARYGGSLVTVAGEPRT